MQQSTEHHLPEGISIPKSKLVFGEAVGEGSYGEVFQGEWTHTTLHKTPVAIKQLKLKTLPARIKADFVREVSVHATLDHPQVVKLYGVSIEQPYCMVMEYLPQGSLRDYLDARLPESVTWHIRFELAQAITAGLHYLHSQQPAIIHGDLKSLNILMDTEHQAKLGDFGLAKIKTESSSQFYASGTEQKSTKGSLLWMAPELFLRRAKRTSASDVYALAMVMWEIASHQFPFSDGVYDASQIKDWVKEGERETFPDGTPSSYQQIVRRCWDSNAAKRPASATVVELLRSASATEQQAPVVKKKVVGKAKKAAQSKTKTVSTSMFAAPPAKNTQLLQQLPKTAQGCIDQSYAKMSTTVSQEQINQLLTYVMRGDLEHVRQCLQQTPNLVYCPGDITDLSKRHFPNITGFQYACWALDKEMWELFLACMPQEAAAHQLKALEEERPDITEHHGAHFSFELILERYEHYISNFDGWNWKEREAYWCQQIGGAQRLYPAWLIMMMCEEGSDVAWVNKDLLQPVKRHDKLLGWWSTLEANGGSLGDAWAAVRMRTRCFGRSSPTLPRFFAAAYCHHDQIVSTMLSTTRSAELVALQNQLYSAHASLSSKQK